MTSGFHICTCGNTHADTIHEEQQRKFKGVQRALSSFLLEEHKDAIAEMLWMAEEGSVRLVRRQPWRAMSSSCCVPHFYETNDDEVYDFMICKMFWKAGPETGGCYKTKQLLWVRRKLFSELSQKAFILPNSQRLCELQRPNSVHLAEHVKCEFI